MFHSKRLLTLLAAAALAMGVGSAFAGSVTQNVTVNVSTISNVTVSGNVNLTVFYAPAGSQPQNISDATTTISWSTNEATQKITAGLDATDGGGHSTGLTVQATSPGAGTAAAPVDLNSGTAGTLISGVGNTASSATLTYTASAGITVPSNTTDSYVIVYTITS